MAVCPRGIHFDGSCSCHLGFSAEESGSSARSGISRIVMLAEALFEVLDQIHQQPVSLSLSMVSLPATESVVDSFLVKTPGKSVRSQPKDDVTQGVQDFCLCRYHVTQAKISMRLLTKGKVNSIYVPSPYLME